MLSEDAVDLVHKVRLDRKSNSTTDIKNRIQQFNQWKRTTTREKIWMRIHNKILRVAPGISQGNPNFVIEYSLILISYILLQARNSATKSPHYHDTTCEAWPAWATTKNVSRPAPKIYGKIGHESWVRPAYAAASAVERCLGQQSITIYLTVTIYIFFSARRKYHPRW